MTQNILFSLSIDVYIPRPTPPPLCGIQHKPPGTSHETWLRRGTHLPCCSLFLLTTWWALVVCLSSAIAEPVVMTQENYDVVVEKTRVLRCVWRSLLHFIRGKNQPNTFPAEATKSAHYIIMATQKQPSLHWIASRLLGASTTVDPIWKHGNSASHTTYVTI